MRAPIRVLIVDDSAFARQVFQIALAADPAIQVVGVAPDPYAALEKIPKLHPDVLTLDVEMPGMNGLALLERLMRSRPMPVVMVSSWTEAGCETTLRALELGAVDFVCKPKVDIRERLPEIAQEIIEKVKMAAAARVRRARGTFLGVERPGVRRPVTMAASPIIAVGASTGGTEAIRELLSDMPPDFPGAVIVQHMPSKFTRAFAERLDKLCQVRVKEAEDGDPVLIGHVLIAPGDYHMRLVREQGTCRVRISQDPPVNRHRPSVDVLFHSCADCVGANTVGVLLTGMGEDGARGLLAMRQAGSATFAQDEATSVVFGMPKAAVELGAVSRVLPLHRLLDGVRGALGELGPRA